MTWLTVMEYLCHKWPRIYSTCRKHFPFLSSFMTYHRVCNKINTTGATSGAVTAYPSGAPEFTPSFSGVRVTRSFVLYVCFVDRCYTPAPRRGRGYAALPLSVRPSVLPPVQDIFRRILFSNCWWQKSDIWSQASYRYPISWEAFLDPSDSYFLFADFVNCYTHWTYMLIFRRIFLSNYWWQKSDIWSQASYRYPISWKAFLDPSDSYFLFADFVDFNTHLTYICICTFFVAFF